MQSGAGRQAAIGRQAQQAQHLCLPPACCTCLHLPAAPACLSAWVLAPACLHLPAVPACLRLLCFACCACVPACVCLPLPDLPALACVRARARACCACVRGRYSMLFPRAPWPYTSNRSFAPTDQSYFKYFCAVLSCACTFALGVYFSLLGVDPSICGLRLQSPCTTTATILFCANPRSRHQMDQDVTACSWCRFPRQAPSQCASIH